MHSPLAFVDCHAHLTAERFSHDLPAVLARAQRTGVQAILVCSTSLSDIPRVTELCRQHPGFLYPCLGLHPLNADFDDNLWAVTRSMIEAGHDVNGLAALGEIGLDFSRPLLKEQAAAKGLKEADIRSLQVAKFEAHIALAVELGIPVNVHSRNAELETLQILARAGVRGVMHAYKGDVNAAVEAAKAGRLLFSFPPSTVYKREYQEVAKAVPLDSLLLETDSPSLGAGGPKERNEPGFINLAARKIAELRKVPVEDIVSITTRNAIRLFGCGLPKFRTTLEASLQPRFTSEAGKKPPRWSKKVDTEEDESKKLGNEAIRTKWLQNDSTVEPPVPHSEASAGSSSSRWQRRNRKKSDGYAASMSEATMDPTVCSSAYGSAFCD
eukprot:TRINITY_DN32634_c0_g1_i1.p1 TRINITY_DN32634_c0_g1~~TRINITY_DN32634_c0_g1_i1.p1  ORF type:complete len:383 (-),score=46.85 TRINITY_DN32634_c0_g1_i1:199-1347(-)